MKITELKTGDILLYRSNNVSAMSSGGFELLTIKIQQIGKVTSAGKIGL